MNVGPIIETEYRFLCRLNLLGKAMSLKCKLHLQQKSYIHPWAMKLKLLFKNARKQ